MDSLLRWLRKKFSLLRRRLGGSGDGDVRDGAPRKEKSLSSSSSSSAFSLPSRPSSSSWEEDVGHDFHFETPPQEDLLIDPEKLDSATRQRRVEILEALVDFGVIAPETAIFIEETPRNLECFASSHRRRSPNSSTFIEVNNHLWLPDEDTTDPKRSAYYWSGCFADFINFRLKDPSKLRELLSRPVNVANCDADVLSRILDPTATIADLLELRRGDGVRDNNDEEAEEEEEGEVFYSFCLGRAVLTEETQHCSRCHVCNGWRFWHCNECDNCSFGMSLGRCEHCGFRDDVSSASADSVDSVSDLLDEEPWSRVWKK